MKKHDSALRLCPGYTGSTYSQEAHNLPESAFYADAARRGGGLSRLCKACHKARGSDYFREVYYPSHKAKIIEGVVRRRKSVAQK